MTHFIFVNHKNLKKLKLLKKTQVPFDKSRLLIKPWERIPITLHERRR